MRDKWQKFVHEYLQCWNASEAAKRAGYAFPGRAGHRLLKYVEIQKAIKSACDNAKMSAEEVVNRLGEQGRAEYSKYIRADGTVDLDQIIADGKQHLIKSVKHYKNGRTQVEFYDAQAALALVGRHHRLFAESTEHTVTLRVPALEEVLSKVYGHEAEQGEPD